MQYTRQPLIWLGTWPLWCGVRGQGSMSMYVTACLTTILGMLCSVPAGFTQDKLSPYVSCLTVKVVSFPLRWRVWGLLSTCNPVLHDIWNDKKSMKHCSNVHMCVCTRTHAHRRRYRHSHTQIHTDTQTQTHTNTQTHTLTHMHAFVRTLTCKQI